MGQPIKTSALSRSWKSPQLSMRLRLSGLLLSRIQKNGNKNNAGGKMADYFLRIINPTDPSGEKVQAIIPYDLISKYYKFHPVRYENFRAAKYVLDNPKRIFAGIRQFNE